MQPTDLEEQLASGYLPFIIDVRSSAEFLEGHIPGAIHAPARDILLQRAPLPASKSAKLIITCEHGHRAQLAKGLLYTLGYQYVVLLDGHMAEWKISGRPLEK